MSKQKVSGGYARGAQAMLLLFFLPLTFFLTYIVLSKNYTLEGILFLLIFYVVIALVLWNGFTYADIFYTNETITIKKIFISRNIHVKEIQEINKALMPFTYYIRFLDKSKIFLFSDTTDIFTHFVSSNPDKGLEALKTKLSIK